MATTGSANTLFIDGGTNNVGIGTASPSEELTIRSSVPKIQIEDSDGTNQYGQFYHSAGITSILARNNTSDGTIVFQKYDGTTTDETMRIDSSGNVGIKTNNPTSLLHIFDGQGGTSAQTDLLTLQTQRSDFGSGGSSILFFDTESPPETSGGNASSRGRIKAYTENADEFQTDFRFSLSDRSDSAITSISADTTTITVVHVTSVGLGVEVGDYVTIQATTNFNEDFVVTGVDSNTQFTIAATGYDGFAEETSGNVAKSETFDRMVITGGGNVGIGTNSPSARLEIISDGSAAVGAEIRLQHANNNTNDVVSTVNFANNAGSVAMIQGGTIGANNSGYIDFFTDNAGTSARVARMTPEGNIGIGTDSPKRPLQIGATNQFPISFKRQLS